MIETKRFTDDHNNLLNIAEKLSKNLDINKLSKDAKETKIILSDLLSHLHVHLSVEDKAIYPLLLSHSDSYVKSTAQEFVTQFEDIREKINQYKHTWSSTADIQNNPTLFIEQTNDLIAVLLNRIELEDNDLYSYLETLEDKNTQA